VVDSALPTPLAMIIPPMPPTMPPMPITEPTAFRGKTSPGRV